MKTKMKKFPKTPFKLDCGDKPEVRQWLRDNGCVWSNGESLTAEILEAKFLVVDTLKYIRWGEHINDFIDNTVGVFNPFKKKSKLEQRVEELEKQITSPGLLMKITEDLSSLPSFRCKTVVIKEEPKPVSIGRYKPERGEGYYYINMKGAVGYICMDGERIDLHNISTGNCYRTSQEAEQELARQQALVRVNDRIDELNDGWVADYSNDEHKYSITSIHRNGNIDTTVWAESIPTSIFNPIVTKYKANIIIAELEEDIKLAAGWEK